MQILKVVRSEKDSAKGFYVAGVLETKQGKYLALSGIVPPANGINRSNAPMFMLSEIVKAHTNGEISSYVVGRTYDLEKAKLYAIDFLNNLIEKKSSYE